MWFDRGDGFAPVAFAIASHRDSIFTEDVHAAPRHWTVRTWQSVRRIAGEPGPRDVHPPCTSTLSCEIATAA